MIKLMAGLGNPGKEYAETRHNVGFWWSDAVARHDQSTFHFERRFHADVCALQRQDGASWLIKPHTYVNRSGQAVAALAAYYKLTPQDIMVAHDDMDLPVGCVRFKEGGGHGGHNGLRDIIRHIGDQFCRLRFGIGHPGSRERVVSYVLESARSVERQAIELAIERTISVLPDLSGPGRSKAVQYLHTDV